MVMGAQSDFPPEVIQIIKYSNGARHRLRVGFCVDMRCAKRRR
jgi:hypothetical protein